MPAIDVSKPPGRVCYRPSNRTGYRLPRPRTRPTMIIETEQDVTKAVLAELERAPNARFREVMAAFVRHLHDFAREVTADRGGVPRGDELHRQDRAGLERDPQRGGADLRLARLLAAHRHAQQRRQRRRHRRQPARPVLAHAFAADRERRLDRALADARRSDVRQRAAMSTRRASRSPASRSTSGIRRPKASTRTRTRCRPT